jgi:hypothetical protein
MADSFPAKATEFLGTEALFEPTAPFLEESNYSSSLWGEFLRAALAGFQDRVDRVA